MAASIDNLVNVNFIKGDIDLLNFGLMLGGSGQHKPFQFSPAMLFDNGEQGAWYLIRPELLFQDAAGTVPVTADGDPVALMLDQSGNGNHSIQAVSSARTSYDVAGELESLEGDGVDDDIVSQDAVPWLTSSTANAFFAIAFKANTTSPAYVVHCDGSDTDQTTQSFSVLSYIFGEHKVNIGGSPFTIPATLSAVILYCQFNKSTGEGVISWNGGAEETITVGSQSKLIFPMRLFARAGGVNFNGKIYGVVGAEGPVSFDNRRNVMNYLAGLAGVTL